jgi:hypothetical protein
MVGIAARLVEIGIGNVNSWLDCRRGFLEFRLCRRVKEKLFNTELEVMLAPSNNADFNRFFFNLKNK